jgi:hypothetical protein
MGNKPTQHTPAELKDIADRVDEVTGHEDARVRQAREALTAARAALEDYTRPYDPAGWAGRLAAALETLLAFVDETAPGGQLDRTEHAVTELLVEVRKYFTANLHITTSAGERLERIETKVTSVHGAIVAAVETEMTDKRSER